MGEFELCLSLKFAKSHTKNHVQRLIKLEFILQRISINQCDSIRLQVKLIQFDSLFGVIVLKMAQANRSIHLI